LTLCNYGWQTCVLFSCFIPHGYSKTLCESWNMLKSNEKSKIITGLRVKNVSWMGTTLKFLKIKLQNSATLTFKTLKDKNSAWISTWLP
jgi:hypothetical protein